MKFKSGDKVSYKSTIYDFGYYSQIHRCCVLYDEGKKDVQDSITVPVVEVTPFAPADDFIRVTVDGGKYTFVLPEDHWPIGRHAAVEALIHRVKELEREVAGLQGIEICPGCGNFRSAPCGC